MSHPLVDGRVSKGDSIVIDGVSWFVYDVWLGVDGRTWLVGIENRDAGVKFETVTLAMFKRAQG